MDVGFHHGGIHTQVTTGNNFVLAGESYQALLHVTDDLRPQCQHQAPQRLSIRHRAGAHTCQLAVQQTAIDLALHILKAPVKDMFERQQAQHYFGGCSRTAAVAAVGMTFGQGFVRQFYQLFVVQDPV